MEMVQLYMGAKGDIGKVGCLDVELPLHRDLVEEQEVGTILCKMENISKEMGETVCNFYATGNS